MQITQSLHRNLQHDPQRPMTVYQGRVRSPPLPALRSVQPQTRDPRRVSDITGTDRADVQDVPVGAVPADLRYDRNRGDRHDADSGRALRPGAQRHRRTFGGACSIKIVDACDNEVPRGTVGEIVARGDNVMLGYWKKRGETATTVRDGWMHTGDGGYMNGDGYIFVVDRIKDMIITGGENVYSTEVENALAKHSAVATSAVIGLPDEKWAERVHAVVVLHAGATAEPGELTEFCRAHIANYKVPRGVTFVDVLPTTPAGKVLKRELRQQLREGARNPVTKARQ